MDDAAWISFQGLWSYWFSPLMTVGDNDRMGIGRRPADTGALAKLKGAAVEHVIRHMRNEADAKIGIERDLDARALVFDADDLAGKARFDRLARRPRGGSGRCAPPVRRRYRPE